MAVLFFESKLKLLFTSLVKSKTQKHTFALFSEIMTDSKSAVYEWMLFAVWSESWQEIYKKMLSLRRLCAEKHPLIPSTAASTYIFYRIAVKNQGEGMKLVADFAQLYGSLAKYFWSDRRVALPHMPVWFPQTLLYQFYLYMKSVESAIKSSKTHRTAIMRPSEEEYKYYANRLQRLKNAVISLLDNSLLFVPEPSLDFPGVVMSTCGILKPYKVSVWRKA